MSASFKYAGYKYLYGSIFGSNFTADIHSEDALKCSNSTEYGMDGFAKRVNYLVAGINNAYAAFISPLCLVF